MTPIIVALYDDYGIADRVRTGLVADGFPTDRVKLTSLLETGQADAEPGDAFVARGANSAITVHPRTDYEIDSARQILHRNSPLAMEEILH